MEANNFARISVPGTMLDKTLLQIILGKGYNSKVAVYPYKSIKNLVLTLKMMKLLNPTISFY